MNRDEHPAGWGDRLRRAYERPPTRREFIATLLTLPVMVTAVVFGPLHSPSVVPAGLTVVTVVSWLPLLVRTQWPTPAAIVVLAVEVLHLWVLGDLEIGLSAGHQMGAFQPIPVPLMVAIFTVALLRPPAESITVTSVSVIVLLGTMLASQPLDLLGTDLVAGQLVVIALGAGLLVRGHRERVRARAVAEVARTQRAVVDERLRIARELHDTLAHTLALVDVQAGVAEYLLDTDPGAAHTALKGITGHTAAAFHDLRATLDLLRADQQAGQSAEDVDPTLDPGSRTPLPGLAMVPELVSSSRGSGLTVDLTEQGPVQPLSHQCDLAAYRILQEGLTNAAKHAPFADICLTIDWSSHRLLLAVTNGPTPSITRPGRGTGRGLIGLHERVRLAGGNLETGPTPSGGYRLTATLPVEAEPPAGHA